MRFREESIAVALCVGKGYFTGNTCATKLMPTRSSNRSASTTTTYTKYRSAAPCAVGRSTYVHAE